MNAKTIGVSLSLEEIKELVKQAGRNEEQENEIPEVERTMLITPAALAACRINNSTETIANGTLTSRLEGQETIMTRIGEDNPNEPLSASLLMLNSKLRGERYYLDKERIIIGSDQSCDICLEDSDIPARYAILIKKDEGHFAGPLSSEGIVLNDLPRKDTEDIRLQRGDVLTVGSSKLRFVEAREVFTLQDEVADRVIDRPQSKTPKVLAAAAGCTALLCLLVFAAYRATVSSRLDAARIQAAKELADKKALIAKLRSEGDELFKAGALIEPVENNAQRRFEQILQINPEDTYSKRRLSEIRSRVSALSDKQIRQKELDRKISTLLADAERYFQEGSYLFPPGKNAKEAYETVLRLDPNNQAAMTKLAELNSFLGNLLGEINALLVEAENYQSQGMFVSPPGANAYETYKRVLSIDPQNERAKNAVYDMAAASIVRGDRAKGRGELRAMQQAYFSAQALGVDPAYLTARLEGAELIGKAKSSMIFYDRGAPQEEDKKTRNRRPRRRKKAEPSTPSKYLDRSELEKRMAVLELESKVGTLLEKKRFIDMRSSM